MNTITLENTTALAIFTPTQAQIDKSLVRLAQDLTDAIQSVGTMRDAVQHGLVGIVSHYKMTGNNNGLKDMVNTFIQELGKGIKSNSVKEWCIKHLHMVEHADGKTLVFMAIDSSTLDTNAANADTWWTVKAAKSDDEVECGKALDRLIKKSEKDLKLITEDASVKTDVDVETLKLVIAHLQSIKTLV